MRFEEKQIHADLVVVGAGMPGICAALQAAREGIDVVLINDRGVVGGNCSAEVNITAGGAPDCAPLNINSREGGIVEEIRTETAYRTPEHNRYLRDAVFRDIMRKEKNLRLFLNTCIDSVQTDTAGKIVSVSGTQNTTETRYTFYGKFFADDTGDGTLGALAGADYMIGREAKSTFHEMIAPDEADSFVIPSTLTFTTRDMGRPITFVAPDDAIDIEKSGALLYRTIPHDKLVMQWYYEGDGAKDQVKQREEIMDDHHALVYGIWDYIKNSGKYPEAVNYDLDYVAMIPGVREYRRLCGDKILIESDLIEQREYEDGVGHGGWNIDLHAIHGFFDHDLINRHIHFRGPYQIPYRCGYSRNVGNLFMCGRCMSTSHVAFGSTRVAATLSTLGQAVGMAAAMCVQKDTTPRGVYEKYMPEMRQRLLREGQLILGLQNQDPNDRALQATVHASSEAELCIPATENTMPMSDGIALVLPVANHAEDFILLGMSDADTELEYEIYRPIKGYNFGPDALVKRGTVHVAASEELREISVPVSDLSEGSYFFFNLLPNAHMRFAFAEDYLLTTIQHKRYQNTATNIWEYGTMNMSGYTFDRDYQRCLCYRFSPAQKPYAAAQVVNGYNRAYHRTNLWLSASEDTLPTLTLSWEKPVELSMLQITFAVDTTLKIYRYDKRILRYLSTDYKVYGLYHGTETLLAEIQKNHQARNRIPIAKGMYDGIRFVFEHNHGGQVGVQEVRAE